METFLITLGAFSIIILIMSVGILFNRKPIKGTCGGISAVMGTSSCDICEHKDTCSEEEKAVCENNTVAN